LVIITLVLFFRFKHLGELALVFAIAIGISAYLTGCVYSLYDTMKNELEISPRHANFPQVIAQQQMPQNVNYAVYQPALPYPQNYPSYPPNFVPYPPSPASPAPEPFNPNIVQPVSCG
jgi:hypothetical protein